MQKYLLFFLACMFSLAAYGQRSTTINVSTHKLNCTTALISAEEAGNSQWGWWDAWHEKKARGDVFQTPHIFNFVEPGEYTLVVYWTDGDVDHNPPTDGIAIEKIQVQNYVQEISYLLMERDFKDWNCLSCPWLCVFDGNSYVKQEEVIKDVVGRKNQSTTVVTLAPEALIDGKVRIQIREEKDEVSYLDQIVLKVGEQEFVASNKKSELGSIDGNYLSLSKGDVVELEFDLPENVAGTLEVHATGYYEPDPEFMERMTAELLKR